MQEGLLQGCAEQSLQPEGSMRRGGEGGVDAVPQAALPVQC